MSASIRGAVTAAENSRECILESSRELIKSIIEKNSLKIDDIVSIVFTATRDLDKAYPAVAARICRKTARNALCTVISALIYSKI